MWEAAANITFREVPEGTRADILIGAQMEPEGWAFADVFYDIASSEPYKPISRALVCLNPLRRWKLGFDGDLRFLPEELHVGHAVEILETEVDAYLHCTLPLPIPTMRRGPADAGPDNPDRMGRPMRVPDHEVEKEGKYQDLCSDHRRNIP
jgi:hypothetical protein